MNITYTFRHTPASDAFQENCDEKLLKLDRYANGHTSAHVIVEADGHHAMRVEIDFRSKGFHVLASSQGNGEDAYKILDEALTKLEKQMRKHKEKIKEH